MKFKVSKLESKHTLIKGSRLVNTTTEKVEILTVDADRMEEETSRDSGFLLSSQTRLYFYADEIGWWSNRQTLVASALMSGGYVVEALSTTD